MEGRDRLLRWEACRNARDLGGYPTRSGETRWGALIRSDTLCRLTPAGVAALRAYGVRTVIDLRFAEELAREPHPFRGYAAEDGLWYRHMPVNAGRDPAREAELSAAFSAVQDRAAANCLELDVNPVGLTRAVIAVARAPEGGVVVHCHAGKDRTGLVVALVLALLGVPDEVIAADYALSDACLRADYEHWLASEAPADPAEWARQDRLQRATPETMRATLDHLAGRHGGAEAYLRGGGASAEDLALLRQRLTDLTPAPPLKGRRQRRSRNTWARAIRDGARGCRGYREGAGE